MRAHRKLHEKPSNRLPPVSDPVVSSMQAAGMETKGDSVDRIRSTQHSTTPELYHYPTPTIPTSNRPITASNDADTQSLLHSFKISDDL